MSQTPFILVVRDGDARPLWMAVQSEEGYAHGFQAGTAQLRSLLAFLDRVKGTIERDLAGEATAPLLDWPGEDAPSNGQWPSMIGLIGATWREFAASPTHDAHAFSRGLGLAMGDRRNDFPAAREGNPDPGC